MIPNEDVYADKDGKVTKDPTQYARQIAVAGFFLDDKIAKRYGIADTLVSADEPNAAPVRVRKVETETDPNKAEKLELEENTETREPQEPVVAAEPKTKESKASVTVKRAEAKKGEKKK
jgi:hypothetical protein